MSPSALIVERLRAAGIGRGDLVGLAVTPGIGAGFAVRRPDHAAEGAVEIASADPSLAAVAAVEAELRPRWVWWSIATPMQLVAADVRASTCWDVAAVQRVLDGGWRMDAARAWARLHDLPVAAIPEVAPLDLFTEPDHEGDVEQPVRDDGYLRPDWVDGDQLVTPTRLARWAATALDATELQHRWLTALADHPMAVSTARSESAAELLCAELAHDGLPVDRGVAEQIVAGFVGPRLLSEADEAEHRRRRDREVLRHAPAGTTSDLRNPAQVKSLLRSVGVEVPDTRASRLEPWRDAHPLVEALLTWRKAERIATTFGYGWLDQHVGSDGRLRGEWSGSDGAAGRMTASVGLHNMPAALRPAVLAEPGHTFVRADLGQIEPRVLAAVSGDRALARATQDDDLYAPVAAELGVDRPTAKVAVLGAMYGQTTGRGAQVLRRLERAYPVAMRYLHDADVAGQSGRDLRTYGGRLVRLGFGTDEVDERAARSRAAAQGRFGRNAMVQGAAAELFKVWAATVRARGQAIGARIVLCLHDELLVHVPVEQADRAAALVDECLAEAAHRWAPDASVRFVADTAVVRCWADAKA